MSNSLFSSPETEQRNRSSDSAVSKLLLALVALPFIPAIAFGVIVYWVLLRTLKLRRSVSGLIVLALLLLSYGALQLFGGFTRVLQAFTNPGGIVDNWGQLFYVLTPLSIALGALIGYGIILWDVRDIHNNPHRVELPGFWTYQLQWRKTPLELLKKRRALRALRSGELIEDNRAPLGYEESEDRVAFRFVEESIKHTLVTGAAGSGKTISMLSMMRADIESGRTVIAVDFKRSPEFAAKLAAWSAEFSVPFYHFEKGKPESYRIQHSLGQSTYDPFASGSGSEMVLNMREYDTSSAVYKGHMQQFLQIIFAMMEQADRKKAKNVDWDHGGIYQLASAITDTNLQDLLAACEGQPIFREAEDYIPRARSGKGMENHALEELRGQMRTIVASAYGRWFKIGDGSRNIDLLEMMTGDQSIVLFSFNSEDEPELSRYVGSMIFADLRAVSSHIRNRKASKVTSVYVDEFQAVPPTAVNGLLEKARESKIAMTLAQQAFEQIITSSQSNGEAYLQSILVTCSNFLTHAGMTQDSAERVSKLLGKRWKTVYSRTNKSDGGFLKNNFSNRRNQIVSASNQEVWKVEPAEFMELSAPVASNGYKSTAILVNKTVADPNIKADGTIARKLWMVPPQCVLDEYVEPLAGDEKNLQAEKLYTDSKVTAVVSAEELELQKSYEENTPVYREDSEVVSRVVAPAFEETSSSTIDSEDSGFDQDDDFDSVLVPNTDDDGDFTFEELEDTSETGENESSDSDDPLAAFDDATQFRATKRTVKNNSTREVKPTARETGTSRTRKETKVSNSSKKDVSPIIATRPSNTVRENSKDEEELVLPSYEEALPGFGETDTSVDEEESLPKLW